MKIYNAELVESVQAFDKEIDGFYYWLDGFSLFGFSLIDAGWRERWTGEIRTEQQIKETRLIENGIVYHKPYVFIRCASGQTETKRFETFEEARRAASNIALKFNIRLTL